MDPASGPVEPTASRPVRLLIVDDVADNRTVLARRFARRGFEIEEAEDGRKALELIGDHPRYDAVLLDVVMPGMSGLEVLRQLRARFTRAELPVVMVTARAETDDMVQALSLGANDYLTKPVNFAVAFLRVEAQVERKLAKEESVRTHEALRDANAALEANVSDLQAAMQAAHAGEVVKGEFLANMSHEIRTPLNGIIGLTDVLAATHLDALQRELVGTVRSSAETLERVLGDILASASADAGRVEVRKKPFRLADCVREVVAACAPAALAKQLSLELDLARECDSAVSGDAVRLKQTLTNLLTNAIKFTDQGAVHVAVTCSGERYRFDVRDTGIGFNEAQKEKLFDRFTQADGSLTRRFGGTGIGLAVARDLARLMGGTLDCASTPGCGSTFSLELPLPPERGPPSSVLIEIDDSRRRVFVRIEGPATGVEVGDALSRMFLGRPELTGFDMLFDLLRYTGDVEAAHVKPIVEAYAACEPDKTRPCRTAFVTGDPGFGAWARAMDFQFTGREHRAFAAVEEAECFLDSSDRIAA